MTKEKKLLADEFNVSRETIHRLEIYEQCLKKWNAKINLVSQATLSELWSRHFLDSAQLIDLAPNPEKKWVDLGSGGGFPGAVVAILLDDLPAADVTLVEADQRKAVFLRHVSRETGVKFNVINERIENIAALGADIISARALAPLDRLLSYAALHLRDDGIALFPKGDKVLNEIEQSLEHWRFRCKEHKSKTNEKSLVLSIGEIQRV